MLLTLSTTHTPATDLGYLLHRHPERCQSFEMSFGQAHVFYPEVTEQRTTAALLLDVDPMGMVRGKNREKSFLLGQYVNDRPYVASSFLSVRKSISARGTRQAYADQSQNRSQPWGLLLLIWGGHSSVFAGLVYQYAHRMKRPCMGRRKRCTRGGAGISS